MKKKLLASHLESLKQPSLAKISLERVQKLTQVPSDCNHTSEKAMIVLRLKQEKSFYFFALLPST